MDARFHCLPNVLPVLLLGDSSYCLSQLYEMKYTSFLVIFSSERCLVWKECLQVGEHFLNILMSPKLILFAMVKSKLKYCPVNAYNIQMYWGQTMCKLLAHSGRPVNSFHAKTGSFQTNSTRFQYQGHHFFLSNVHTRKVFSEKFTFIDPSILILWLLKILRLLCKFPVFDCSIFKGHHIR